MNLSKTKFLEEDLFGFVQATVKAPPIKTSAGYIGLLPVRLNGRLVCPGGIFSGLFFSEELKFAIKNHYELISIEQAYSFDRGVNTFLDLIQTLNKMKIEAQFNNQPTIRNIAKLLMNSMYGRFGMHTDNLRHNIVDEAGFLGLQKNYIITNLIQLGDLKLVSYTLSDIQLNRTYETAKIWIDEITKKRGKENVKCVYTK